MPSRHKTTIVLQIFVFVVLGFCYSNSASLSGQSRTANGFKSQDTFLKTMNEQPEKETQRLPMMPDRIMIPRVRRNTGVCAESQQLRATLHIFLGYISNAWQKAKKCARSTTSFITVLQSPSQLLRSMKNLARELKRTLAVLNHHYQISTVRNVRSKFQYWNDSVEVVVQRLQAVNTTGAQVWLRNIYLALDHQTKTFDRLSKDIKLLTCSSNADPKILTKALSGVLTQVFLPQKTLMDTRWDRNKDLMIEVSKQAVNLASEMFDVDSTATSLESLRTNVGRRLSRRSRQLRKFVELHSPLRVSDQVLDILRREFAGNWKEKLEASEYGSFLTNISASKRQTLEEHMVLLKGCVQDLTQATMNVRSSTFNAIIGINDYETPAAFAMIGKLFRSLKELLKHGEAESNAEALATQVLNQLQIRARLSSYS